jgi:transposase
MDVTISSERVYKKRFSKKGRPAPNEEAKLTWTQKFSMSFELNQANIKNEELLDGIFPLITNIIPSYSAKDVLEIYKYQPFLEKRHSQLKTRQLITPALFKSGIRIVAYIHMHVIALMISTLIERTLRVAMSKNSIDSLPIYPDGKECRYPTLYGIVRFFRDVEKYEVTAGEDTFYFPAKLNSVQKKVINLLDVPVSLYQ